MSQIRKALKSLERSRRDVSGQSEGTVLLPMVVSGEGRIDPGKDFELFQWRNGCFSAEESAAVIDLTLFRSRRSFLELVQGKHVIFLIEEIDPSSAEYLSFFRNIIFVPCDETLDATGELMARICYARIKNLISGSGVVSLEPFQKGFQKTVDSWKKRRGDLTERVIALMKWATQNVVIEGLRTGRLEAIRDIRKSYSRYFDDSLTIFQNVKDVGSELSNPKYIFSNNYLHPGVPGET